MAKYIYGFYLLVAIDTNSTYPEVKIVSSTSSTACIKKLGAIFSRQGSGKIRQWTTFLR